MPSKVTIQNGQFQDAAGNAVNGTLTLRLIQDAVVTGTGTVVPGDLISIVVTAGNAAATPIWGTDNLTPSGLVYVATVYDSSGGRVWGPENWSITGAGPIEINTLTPSSAAVAYPTAIITNPSADQTISVDNLLPAAGNTTQSLGSSVAPWKVNGSWPSLAPVSSYGLQFVSATGNDVNDGLSWGTAKATIAAAIGALPSCTSGASTWAHSGMVLVGAGTYTVSSTITIASPFVSIVGQSEKSTIISYTGTGPCFLFNPSTYNGGQNSTQAETLAGGLFSLTIDGTSAGAAAFGIKTLDIAGFHCRQVGISNFSGAGSKGWYATTSTNAVPSERYNVELEITNCTVGWHVVSPSPGGGTFGYGKHQIFVNPNNNQTAIIMDGVVFNIDTVHIVVNGPSVPTSVVGISLVNATVWNGCLNMVHIENANTGIQTDATSVFVGNGQVDITNTTTPYSFSGPAAVFMNSQSLGYLNGIGLEPVSPDISFRIGKASDSSASNAALAIGLPTGSTVLPICVGQNGSILFAVDHAGIVYGASAGINIHGATPTGSTGTVGIGNTSGFGNGAAATAVTTTLKGTGTGPTTPQTVVNYLEIDLAGTKYWVPLVQ